MSVNKFVGGEHKHFYNQTPLDIEKRSEIVTVRLKPSEKASLEAAAEGLPISKFCQNIIASHIENDPLLISVYRALDKYFNLKNF